MTDRKVLPLHETAANQNKQRDGTDCLSESFANC